jgi:prepilin-type N-terminal cleavage/methylation domain-containing protein
MAAHGDHCPARRPAAALDSPSLAVKDFPTTPTGAEATPKRRGGFTLIELLVVIAILAAMLLPAM